MVQPIKESASLCIKNGVVELQGFDKLKSREISFHMMPGGIVINNRDLPNSTSCFTFNADEEYKIVNKYLLFVLRGRDYKEGTPVNFVFIDSDIGGSYFECELHSIPKNSNNPKEIKK